MRLLRSEKERWMCLSVHCAVLAHLSWHNLVKNCDSREKLGLEIRKVWVFYSYYSISLLKLLGLLPLLTIWNYFVWHTILDNT